MASFRCRAWLAAGGTFAIGSDSHISLSPTEELRWLEYEARLATKHRNVLATQSEDVDWRAALAARMRGGHARDRVATSARSRPAVAPTSS